MNNTPFLAPFFVYPLSLRTQWSGGMDVLYIYRFYTCRRSACIGVILSEMSKYLPRGSRGPYSGRTFRFSIKRPHVWHPKIGNGLFLVSLPIYIIMVLSIYFLQSIFPIIINIGTICNYYVHMRSAWNRDMPRQMIAISDRIRYIPAYIMELIPHRRTDRICDRIVRF